MCALQFYFVTVTHFYLTKDKSLNIIMHKQQKEINAHALTQDENHIGYLMDFWVPMLAKMLIRDDFVT